MISPVNQRRRAPRIKTRLRFQVIGLDEDFTLAEGDISVGGLYVDVDREIGELGSVQRLRLATLTGSEQITLLARIARVTTVNDFWRGRATSGVAFQFMFQETTELGAEAKTIPIERSWAIGEFVRCLLRESEAGDAHIDHAWTATLEVPDGPGGEATVNGVSLQGTVLETEFPVPVGELIRVDIPGPDPSKRIPLYGRAIDCRPFAEHEGRGYRTSLSFQPLDGPDLGEAGTSIQEAFGALLSSPTKASPTPVPAEPKRQHFAGDLARISLVSVLTLCELERATGVLHLRTATAEVLCYLREGRLLDVERTDVAVDPQAALGFALGWKEGSFELLFEPVTRADRIGKPINGILLTLMHALDEAQRSS